MFDNSILNFLIKGEINLNWSSLGKLGKFFVDDLTELYHSYFSIYLISNRATKKQFSKSLDTSDAQ